LTVRSAMALPLWAGLAACVSVLVELIGLRSFRPGDAKESPEIVRGGGGDFFWR
jgi:hypothetical protein